MFKSKYKMIPERPGENFIVYQILPMLKKVRLYSERSLKDIYKIL